MFLMIFSLASLKVLATDYEQIPLVNDDCAVTLDPGPTNQGQSSIYYLENMPGPSWFWPKLTGLATLVPLAVAVVPGPVICKFVAGAVACTLGSAILGTNGAFFTIAGVIGTGILCYNPWKEIQKNKQHLAIAELINDAYKFQSSLDPENTIYTYLRNYQARFATDAQSAKQLAEKIILANEAGLFAPVDAFMGQFMNQEVDGFEAYANYQDAPQKNAIFHGLILGQFFGKEPQQIIDELMLMEKEDLENKKSALHRAIEKWSTDVKEYLANVKAAQKQRQINDK